MIALDTNILVYAAEQGDKGVVAREIMLRASLVQSILPVQVLAEFANVCRRKALRPDNVRYWIDDYSNVFTIIPTSVAHLDAAMYVADRYQLAFFDALICAVARDAGATTLLSEDMHDGLRIGTLEILSPLRPENAERLDRILPR